MPKRKRVGANWRNRLARNKERRRIGVSGLFAKVFRTTLAAVFGTFVVVAGYFMARKAAVILRTAEFLQLAKVRVAGVCQVDTADVVRLADISMGTPMISLKPREIRHRIESNPWIEKAHVRRSIPGTIVVSVTEREPIALVNAGNVYLTDRSGLMWTLRSKTYWDLPMFTGLADTVLDGRRSLTAEARARMNRFLDTYREQASKPVPRIGQVMFGEDGSIRVKLASVPILARLAEESLATGVRHLHRLVRMLETENNARIRYIDLCYRNMAFVR